MSVSNRVLPETILVLGETFIVEEVKDLRDSEDATEKLDGRTFGNSYKIEICADLPRYRKWRTLLHEYIHAALYVNGVYAGMPEHLEEVVVQTLEHAFIQFILGNEEKFIKAIKEGVKG